MLKFGLLTNPLIPVTKEICRFTKLGFDYVEIGIEEPAATPKILLKQKNQILELLSKNKMFAIGHTAYWVHFGTSHEKGRIGWIEEGKDMITTASNLKINLLNFHFYWGYGQTRKFPPAIPVFTKNFTISINQLLDFAKKKKITLMLENVPTEKDTKYGIKEYSYVINNSPGLMVHLDVAHAFIEGGMKRVRDYIKTFSDKIVHLHAHDNHGEDDEHLPLGDGSIDYEKIVHWLKEINYDKTVTFEVFTSDRDAVKSREFFKKLWNKL